MKFARATLFMVGMGLGFLAPSLSAQPVITSQPAGQVVVWGGSATFSVAVTGTGPFTYQWQLNGTNLPNNLITTVAGGNLFNNQPATNTILDSPQGTARDGAGNLYIADTFNNVIRKLNTNGIMTIVAGTGSAGYSGDGGAATNAQLFAPEDVIVDPTGNLYIPDAQNNRVRKIDTNGIITRFAGNSIVGGSTGDGGLAVNATLLGPSGLCLDAAGNVYIADKYNYRIRKVDTTGKISTVAGGSPGYGGDGRSALSASLYWPTGVAVDSSNNLYIADSQNNRIRKVTANGIISTVAGNGTAGYSGDGTAATAAMVNLPIGVAVDAAHNLYIADTGNQCIRMVGTNGIITTVAGTGMAGFAGDGGAATNASLASPQHLTVDNTGNLLIADTGNSRIRQVGTNGIITTAAGRRLNDGDYATNATLNLASGIVVDAAGNLFLADTENNRIRKVDTNGIITTVAGLGFTGYTGDGNSATNSALDQPNGVALALNGNLFIADTYNSRIRKIDTNGFISTVAGNGSFGTGGNGSAATNAQLTSPEAVAVDQAGDFFIADTENQNNPIRMVSTNGIISNVPAHISAGPVCISVDTAGDIFYECMVSSIMEIRTNGGDYDFAGFAGVTGFAGDGNLAYNARLNNPEGAVPDPLGNVVISDTYNHRIRKVYTNGIINTIAGTGVEGFSGDGGPGNNAALDLPVGIALDAGGNVYFADTGNNRIRKLSYVDYADQPTFTVTNVTPASVSNYYSVIITSPSGSITSSVASVSLQLPPLTAGFTAANATCNLSWSAVSNLTYQLQYTTNLMAPVWIDLGSPITPTSNSVTAGDAIGSNGQRFYRVRSVP